MPETLAHLSSSLRWGRGPNFTRPSRGDILALTYFGTVGRVAQTQPYWEHKSHMHGSTPRRASTPPWFRQSRMISRT